MIEDLTDDITQDFRRASEQVAKLAKQTTEALRSKRLSKPEVTAARNAQTALATRVQHMSSVFRQKQSTYLRKLQGMEIQEPQKREAWLLDDEDSVRDDVALVRFATYSSQSSGSKASRHSLIQMMACKKSRSATGKCSRLPLPLRNWHSCFRI